MLDEEAGRAGWKKKAEQEWRAPWVARGFVALIFVTLGGCRADGEGAATNDPISETATEPLPHWTLKREIVIGSLNDPSQTLTNLHDLVVDDSGRIYASQPMEQKVKVFSPLGELLYTIGRKGEGPGEFSRPGKVGWMGDTLWVSETRMPKVSLFEADGTFIRSHLLRKDLMEGPYTPSRIEHVLSDGTVFASTTADGRLVMDGIIQTFPFLHLDPRGRVLDQVAIQAMGNSILQVPVADGRGVALPHPLPTRPLLAAVPDGDAVIFLDRMPKPADARRLIHLHKITAMGDTLFSTEIPCPDLDLSSEYVDGIARPIAERMARSGAVTADAILPNVREALDLATNAPLALQLVVAENGEIWIQKYTGGEPGQSWDILSSEGVPIATLSAPAGTTIHSVSGEHVWASEQDALDVPYIVRYIVRY